MRTDGVPSDPDLGGVVLPEPGEQAGLARWREFLDGGASSYAETRNRPAVDGTSAMSAYLKYGCVHPRTLHAELGHDDGASKLTGELVWRDFYADCKDLHLHCGAAPGTSCSTCATATWPPTSTAGSGWPVRAATRHPVPIVDHAAERTEALRRYEAVRR